MEQEPQLAVSSVFEGLFARIPSLRDDARIHAAIANEVRLQAPPRGGTRHWAPVPPAELTRLPLAQAHNRDGSVLRLLYDLLCTPEHTLAVAACVRPHLLRLVSSLVEGKLAGTITAISNEALSLALLKVLLLAPHTKIPAVKFFTHHPDICHHLATAAPMETDAGADAGEGGEQGQAQQPPLQEELALYAVAALDAAPELLTTWRSADFLQLLAHQVGCPALPPLPPPLLLEALLPPCCWRPGGRCQPGAARRAGVCCGTPAPPAPARLAGAAAGCLAWQAAPKQRTCPPSCCSALQSPPPFYALQSCVVRWAAVRVVALLLGMADAATSRLSRRVLSEADELAALEAWRDQTARLQVERAGMWLCCPHGCPHCR
jgi:hypothetical protein